MDNVFRKYKIDKYFGGIYGHNYEPFYDMILRNKRDEYKNILEIGVATGGSLKMWKEYFPNSYIYGWDIIDESHLIDDRIKTFMIDQGKEEQINIFFKYNNVEFDFVIDDGSHMPNDQIISLFNIFQKLKSGGIYIVEDMWHDVFDCFLKIGYKKDYYNFVDDRIKNIISEDKIKYLLDNLVCCQKNNVIFSSGEDKSDHQFYVFYKK